MQVELKKENLPNHVAIIMDGNGRWASSRGLSRTQGHIAGVKRVEEVLDAANEAGIGVLTMYTFSTENWRRPKTEVAMLMNTLSAVLQRKTAKLVKDNIRFQTIGRREKIPESVLQIMDNVIEQTKNCTGMVMNLAFNYGSRVEIVDAVQLIAQSVKNGTLEVEQITEQTISQSLYTKNLPDPDLLIRTSGEKRVSNFLLWQLSYAEFYFTDKYWPDFDTTEFHQALLSYQNRERRFGHSRATKV